jgi:hypothetical protein
LNVTKKVNAAVSAAKQVMRAVEKIGNDREAEGALVYALAIVVQRQRRIEDARLGVEPGEPDFPQDAD